MVAPTESRAQLERFLRKAKADSGLDSIYIYPTLIASTPHFGVVYGNYDSRDQAQTALTERSEHWRGQPYLRTVKGIREEIARLHGSGVWD
jgi:septal ring-binding cell division protein DamX